MLLVEAPLASVQRVAVVVLNKLVESAMEHELAVSNAIRHAPNNGAEVRVVGLCHRRSASTRDSHICSRATAWCT